MDFLSQKLLLLNEAKEPEIPLDPIRFDYTGSVQTYIIPEDCYKLEIDAVGARGGGLNNSTTYAGLGGRVQCDLEVTPGQELFIYVGGVGTSGAGWNGGGRRNEAQSLVTWTTAGGGATDIRTVQATSGSWYDTSHTSWDTDASLLSRLVVAGAGGGFGDYNGYTGGHGGGLIGGQGSGIQDNPKAGGGTQTEGGVAGVINSQYGEAGMFGKGGDAKQRSNTTFGFAGGGGGWYGGGSSCLDSAGGGSSYTHPTLCSKVYHTQGYSEAIGNGWLIIVPIITPSYTTDPVEFNYTGSVQTYTVPMGCSKLHIDAYGAAGGNNNLRGGYGGRVECDLDVTYGQELYIYVGSKGSNSVGWNGGGRRNTGNSYPDSGGGATDIRTVQATSGSWYDTSHSSWDTDASLLSRLVVAGGGGGYSQNARGADGGGLEGEVVDGGRANPCTPATQTQGGRGASFPDSYAGGDGVFGKGGDGYYNDSMISNWSSAGGGGGWYGGGAGIYFQPGGGGSSYTDASLCSNVVHTQGYSEANGNGRLVITPY